MSADQDGRWQSIVGGIERPRPELADINEGAPPAVLTLSAVNEQGTRVGVKIHIDPDRLDDHFARTLDFAVRDLERWGPIQ